MPVSHRPIYGDAELAVQEAMCERTIQRAYQSCKSDVSTRQRQMLGRGTALLYEPSPYISYCVKDGVHVLFAGEVAEWPGFHAVDDAHDAFMRNSPPLEADDAHWLHQYYRSFSQADAALDKAKQDIEDSEREMAAENNKGKEGKGSDGAAAAAAAPDAAKSGFMDRAAVDLLARSSDELAEKALACLAGIEGTFAFVIYDANQHRVLAGRDRNGTQPLFWGSTPDGQLLIGSSSGHLEGCSPTATLFPAGTLFASERHAAVYQPGEYGWVIDDDELPGQLLSFVKADAQHWRLVKAIPRITSKGVMCGAVYRVASKPNVQLSGGM
ncbi:MAG: hypothetical protein WDW38_003538 [Sanguina aurantia]